MVPPPLPADEAARLAALREYDVLDTQAEPEFDALATLAARTCKTPVAIVGFIDEERHWFKAAVGCGELAASPRSLSFCAHAIAAPDELLLVEDARRDDRFAANPLVVGPPHLRFYAGVPLRTPDGHALGTLCVLDVVPQQLSPDALEMLRALGRQVEVVLEERRTIARLRLFESAIAQTKDAILIQTASPASPAHDAPPLRAVYVNQAFERLTGYELADVANGAGGLLHGEGSAAGPHAILRDAFARGAPASYEVVAHRKDGEPFLAEINIAPVHAGDGRVTHWVSSGREVTDRVRAEAALLHAQSVEAANASLSAEIEQRKTAQERLTYVAEHDEVTGLPNRTCFIDNLEAAIARARLAGRADCALLFIDLDRFKRVNDRLGHLAGDRLLALAAKRLGHALRQSDLLARFGGDEFTVLVEPLDESARAIQIAGRLAEALEAPFGLSGQEVFIRASVGIAMIEPHYTSADDVLRDADIAMYAAKESGGDRHATFHAALRERALRLGELETELRRALERREFAVAYQPLVRLADGSTQGFEALLRWNHPARGLLAPGEFIGVAEETGLIVPIGNFVLTQACRQLRAWHERGVLGRLPTMSINVSAKQLSGDGLPAHLERTLRETGLAPESVHIELTESAMMEDLEQSLRTLGALRELGVKLHVDDFGTGYSSLSYLREFRVDHVKIDRSFVSGHGGPSLADREIVDTIVSLARKLGIEPIAEGVETEEQRRELQRLRCRTAQGFLFSRPLDPAAAQRLLAPALDRASA